jgi:hypothetical protein
VHLRSGLLRVPGPRGISLGGQAHHQLRGGGGKEATTYHHRELQVFLGLVNFYRRFLPGIAVTLRPLTDILKGNQLASDHLVRTPEMEASFMAAKAALGKATWLGHPDPKARLALHVDASSSHNDAALHQQPKGHSTWQPLGFFTPKLEAAQAKLSAFDRELFACEEVICHFQFILVLHHFYGPQTPGGSPGMCF